MVSAQERVDFAAAQSRRDGTVKVQGLTAAVTIRRDAAGIGHISAANEHDAWFGQGYAAAQDRLWQMEYDRRRAVGRWAEVAGPSAVAADVLAKRMQIEPAAKADLAVMSAETRAMFAAYTEGINAFLSSGEPLPVEYALTGITPEPWQVWHSVASFKVRHVLMGQWQRKLARGRAAAELGAERYAQLEGAPATGSVVIVPPGVASRAILAEAAAEVEAAAAHLGFLSELDAGSNSWAVHGSRTTTGMPVICNDSHRALDVPNVYWQVHVSCPEFDVIGATFPGVPGFPHFGHNGSVVWNITHTSADSQDLYIEQFDAQQPGRYRTRDGWAEAELRVEEVRVAGGTPVEVELWRTAHGPVVHGDPRRGWGIALRFTATDAPCPAFEPFRPMLRAKTVEQLFDAQRDWVDPVNNLVAADTSGNIGYQTRGHVPVRTGTAGRLLPVPGWTGAAEWSGMVPFEQMPRSINPEAGFIATANQQVIAGDEPYLSADFAPPWRAMRLVEVLTSADTQSPEQIAAYQADRTSIPARGWATLLSQVEPLTGDAERARALLAGWDGNLLPESSAALLYAYFRRRILKALFLPVTGEALWSWLTTPDNAGGSAVVSRWSTRFTWQVHTTNVPAEVTAPDGRPLTSLLAEALSEAWGDAVAAQGVDPAAWRWDRDHGTNARHTLAVRFPELATDLNPPKAPAGGDADTVQCAAYRSGIGQPFDISNLSVYRQVVSLADIDHGSFVVPGGVAALPGTAHFADQLESWRTHERVPMHYRAAEVQAHTTNTLQLLPV